MTRMDAFHRKVQELTDLFERKNKNYGDSVFEPSSLAPNITPSEAVMVRMSDKIKRIETLLKGEKDRVGESLRDTFTDLAVYTIILLILLDEEEAE